MSNKVVVYGTLMEGESNHSVMQRASGELIGSTAINGFNMYHLGGFPGVLEGDGTIQVEVYEVQDMAPLDRLEGYYKDMPERGLYDRMEVETEFGKAWIYTYNGNPTSKIESGNWRER